MSSIRSNLRASKLTKVRHVWALFAAFFWFVVLLWRTRGDTSEVAAFLLDSTTPTGRTSGIGEDGGKWKHQREDAQSVVSSSNVGTPAPWSRAARVDAIFQRSPLPKLSTLLHPKGGKEGPKDFPPLSCQAMLSPTSVAALDTTLSHQLFIRETDKIPFFNVSLHSKHFDPTRWSVMEWGHYYETALIQAFHAVLAEEAGAIKTSRHAPVRVLDVGGNIGYFTLYAASHFNVVVDAFEPNLKNTFRLCQSLALNGLQNEFEPRSTARGKNRDGLVEFSLGLSREKIEQSTKLSDLNTTIRQQQQQRQHVINHIGGSASRVNIMPYGVGKEIGEMMFEENINPGAGQFMDGQGKAAQNSTILPEAHAIPNVHSIPIVSLDAFAKSRGWLDAASTTKDNNPQGKVDIGILKIDTEGFERNVILGASQLLNSHLVRNIFMEVSARGRKETRDSKFTVQTIAEAGYDVYQFGGFRGPSRTVNWSHKNVTALVDKVMHEVTKKKHPQLNLWWKLPQ